MTENQQRKHNLQANQESNKSSLSSSKKERSSKNGTVQSTKKNRIKKVQIEPSVSTGIDNNLKTNKKKMPTNTARKPKSSSNNGIKKMPKNVKQINNISAGNKNNPYSLSKYKSKTSSMGKSKNTSVLQDVASSEPVKKVAKSADAAMGKAYRKAKALGNKQKPEKKKQKESKTVAVNFRHV